MRRRRDGEAKGEDTMQAVIIQRRLTRRAQEARRLRAEDEEFLQEEMFGADDYEYYVHYTALDRRNDEWVGIDKIDRSSQHLATDDKENKPRLKKRGKRKLEEMSESKNGSHPHAHTTAGGEALQSILEKEHEEITKVKNIHTIELGKYEIETWYFSPYPEEYCSEEKLYICEFCLKYMKKQSSFDRHKCQCQVRYPPGNEIYREEKLSVFEVDGKEHKIYCQNLCLLSKLFLDHKTLYYDVEPFLFYILCEVDDCGCHIVGYFSKEKHSLENYNLACILTFPPYQRLGYGKFLISLSYELTKLQGTVGSPEKPLSDLGKLSYRSYWSLAILTVLQDLVTRCIANTQACPGPNITISDISRATGIKTDDILSTLHSLNLLRQYKGQYIISVSQRVIDAYLNQTHTRRMRLCDPSLITWSPNPSPNPNSDKKSQRSRTKPQP